MNVHEVHDIAGGQRSGEHVVIVGRCALGGTENRVRQQYEFTGIVLVGWERSVLFPFTDMKQVMEEVPSIFV